ncbi:major ampullate spidroin 1B variant 5 [Trichonephila clavata]|uniref:Major ampullate spidroin 1B variant 5 n=1 Tax=Trichonephila clavata TaxID=2740835 RepID=A0A8X6L3V3_TRICU|nr:major ampullate spidroin 1B variant 5 [Trichonephila clavata]
MDKEDTVTLVSGLQGGDLRVVASASGDRGFGRGRYSSGYGSDSGTSATGEFSGYLDVPLSGRVSAAASRLSSPAAGSRVSSTISLLLSNGITNTNALSSAIGNIMYQVGNSNPGLSSCDVTVEALLEILSALLSILGSASIGEINYNSLGQSAEIVSQSMLQALS